MGLFQSKQQPKKKTPSDVAARAVSTVFDKEFREELRTSGRKQFKKAINDNAVQFKHDLDTTIAQLNTDLKEYMTKRLDATISHVNAEMSKRLDERLHEYDKITKDAQDLAVQSLNRNAHALHEKYEQLSASLQKTVATQEAMMINVFEDNQARLVESKNTQDSILQTLQANAQKSQQQTEQLNLSMQKVIADQESAMHASLEENKARITQAADAQTVALVTLQTSAQALQDQHLQLSAMLQKVIADQQSMMVGVFDENMARIIEHYLLGALGDQFDMKAQMPLIMSQLEANKQQIMDDMKL